MSSVVASPYTPEVLADPYGWYRWLHEHSPVYHCADPEMWVLSRYDDVAAALRNPALFSSAEGVTYPRLPLGMMITSDPPDHERLRRVVSRHFTPAAIEARRAAIDRRIREFLDPILLSGRTEFIDDFASPLPVTVIADMLGVPASDRSSFRAWSDDIVEGFHVGPSLDTQKVEAAGRGFAGLGAYLEDAIAERRRKPSDDLVSLLAARTNEGLMTPGELTSFCVLLLVAGNETTTNLLGSLVLSLIEAPDQWRKLREKPNLIGPAIEEALRFRSPIQGLYRTAVRPASVRGVEIPERARVLLLYAAANRDEAKFKDAGVFDIARSPNDHLGFGAGIHFCLGAALSRVEASLTLGALIEQVVSLELDGEPSMRGNPNLYGLSRLPIAFSGRIR